MPSTACWRGGAPPPWPTVRGWSTCCAARRCPTTIRAFDPGARWRWTRSAREQVEITVKYEGYIRRQQRQVEEVEQLEKHALPEDMDYSGIQGLREAREKLARCVR